MVTIKKIKVKKEKYFDWIFLPTVFGLLFWGYCMEPDEPFTERELLDKQWEYLLPIVVPFYHGGFTFVLVLPILLSFIK